LMLPTETEIAGRFSNQGIVNVTPFGSGNINDTYLVTTEDAEIRHFVLQRINPEVFQEPELIMRNMRVVAAHIQKRLSTGGAVESAKWEIPHILPTQDGEDYCIAPDKSLWRALTFINDTATFDTVTDGGMAKQVGCAVGRFHALVQDLPIDHLADTLENYRIAPFYLAQYDRILALNPPNASDDIRYCMGFISERREWSGVLERAKAAGELLLRPIHGDAKVDNILIETETGSAIGIIDLDTVKPGLVHYDIGDCLRSGCNPLGEDAHENWASVYFDLNICRAILTAYLGEVRGFFSENDYAYVYDAIRLAAFELGLRFFADYLSGNTYFGKIDYPRHNLHRALVQFRLAESIEAQKDAICRAIDENQKRPLDQ